MIRLKRVYDPPESGDGIRVLVERLWPKGLTTEKAQVTLWLKEIAPSPELFRWFGHDKTRWQGFRERYREELLQHAEQVEFLRKKIDGRPATFVFAARDEEHNSAVVLKEIVEKDSR